MSIITNYPGWFILLCIIAGLAYAGALYFRDRFNRTYGSNLASLLGVLRFFAVTLLAFFLLKPLIKSIDRIVEKPVIVIAQDNSQSLVIGRDSSFIKTEYQSRLNALTAAFGEDYDIRTYHFGSTIHEGIDSLSFDEKQTDFSNLLDDLYNRYSGRNLGAVIIASDGLYNKGSNPVYGFEKLNVPVYTIALGDTNVYKDLLIADVAANRLAYLNNRFPVRITVEGRKAAGTSAVVNVTRNGNSLFSEVVAVEGERFIRTIDLSLDANELGLQKYTVTISQADGEVTYLNNRKDFFIDVLDSRRKVLILAAAPHPDIAALRDAISSNEGYAADVHLHSRFNGNIADYSLVIFHQLPAVGGAGKELINTAISREVPSLFVWGSATGFREFNELKTGFALENYRNSLTDVNGTVMSGFSLFVFDENSARLLPQLPPLAVPFGDLQISPGAIPFVVQQVGQIKTERPLIAFNKAGETKVGLIAGEGIWRWKLGAFQATASHTAFNELITKTVQYMASREDRSLFRVNGAQDFNEDERIIFTAEVYNPSYEPVTDKEIRMTVRNDEGKEFEYTFSPNGQRYMLDAGQLPVGNYSYVAVVNSNGQELRETGEFSVSPLQLEATNTIADHNLLFRLAQSNGGAMVFPSTMETLPQLIRDKKEVVSVSYENKKLDDLINYKWILFLLIFLLGMEWLLRKRAGTY